MSDQGPVDPFAHGRRVRDLASIIEALAAEYDTAVAPLRDAINAILRAAPDERLGRLMDLHPLVRGLRLQDSIYGSEINTTGRVSPPESRARYILMRMGEAVVANDRERFDALAAGLCAEPAVAQGARDEFRTFALVLLTRAYKAARPEYATRARAAFADAESQYWWAVESDFANAGAPLSTRAIDAIRHWLDEFDAEARYTPDGLLAPLGWRPETTATGSTVAKTRGEITPPQVQLEVSETGKQADNEPDGPLKPNIFRYAGVAVNFGKATLQYRLMEALWDVKRGKPADSREVQAVMNHVYDLGHKTEDATFRKLCSDTRKRLEKERFGLTIATPTPGYVQLEPVA